MRCAEMKSIHRKTKYPPKFVFGGIYGACGNLVLRDGQVFDALNSEKQMLFGTVPLSHLDGVPPNLYCAYMMCPGKQIKSNIERKQRE